MTQMISKPTGGFAFLKIKDSAENTVNKAHGWKQLNSSGVKLLETVSPT